MAQVYFYYSAMNAGKSTSLLQSSYNQQERGMRTLLLTPEIDQRASAAQIASRIGLSADATVFTQANELRELFRKQHAVQKVNCVLIDEAQFLTRVQVEQLCHIADVDGIPV